MTKKTVKAGSAGCRGHGPRNEPVNCKLIVPTLVLAPAPTVKPVEMDRDGGDVESPRGNPIMLRKLTVNDAAPPVVNRAAPANSDLWRQALARPTSHRAFGAESESR